MYSYTVRVERRFKFVVVLYAKTVISLHRAPTGVPCMRQKYVITACNDVTWRHIHLQPTQEKKSLLLALRTGRMLPCQKSYLAKMKEGRTAAATEAARKSDTASHARLNKLRALTENSQCFDCTATRPGWASLPHGVFVCINCAQSHRNLGRHISQTKAINTGTYLWFEHEIVVMEEVGNGVAARAFKDRDLPPKPSWDATPEIKFAYARAKYDACEPNYAEAAAEIRANVPSFEAQQTDVDASTATKMVKERTVKPYAKSKVFQGILPPMSTSSSPGAQMADLISFEEDAIVPTMASMKLKNAHLEHDHEAFFASFGL